VPPQAAPASVAQFVPALRAGLGQHTGAVSGSVSGPAASAVPGPAASAVVQQAPAQVRELVDMWGPVSSLSLMQAVKDQFDPEHRMAPGRFAGGI
jgi:glycolate oxidase FAD binding subunit